MRGRQQCCEGLGPLAVARGVVATITTTAGIAKRWCPLSKQILPDFAQLATKHPSAGFARVDVDVLVAAAERNGAERHGRRMPTLHAWLNGERIGELKGADPEALSKFVLQKLGVAARS
mmetsp:Transcript_61262/g.198169  ORF Transcript_61262/g.198169 Transcript_61262/m.198169 type:complete len:119 (+) Transcript_61262:413-769(+)